MTIQGSSNKLQYVMLKDCWQISAQWNLLTSQNTKFAKVEKDFASIYFT